jgi:hypothetical protein
VAVAGLQLFCILRPSRKKLKILLHKLLLFLCFFIVTTHTHTHTHTHTRAAPTPNKAKTRLGLELFLLLLLHFAIKKTLCVENNNMALRFVLQKPAATPASSFLALPFVVYRSELFIIILYTLLQLLLMFLFCCYIFLSSPTPKKRRRPETKLFAYCLLRKMENNKKMNTKKIKTEKATDVA